MPPVLSDNHYPRPNRGHKTKKARMIKEYALEVLPELTREEIDNMKIENRKREGMTY